jgi:hypothetical protein
MPRGKNRGGYGADYGPMTDVIRAAFERGAPSQENGERSVAGRLREEVSRAGEESAPRDENGPKEPSDRLKNRGYSRD